MATEVVKDPNLFLVPLLVYILYVVLIILRGDYINSDDDIILDECAAIAR